jgi:hypothetical protein
MEVKISREDITEPAPSKYRNLSVGIAFLNWHFIVDPLPAVSLVC